MIVSSMQPLQMHRHSALNFPFEDIAYPSFLWTPTGTRHNSWCKICEPDWDRAIESRYSVLQLSSICTSKRKKKPVLFVPLPMALQRPSRSRITIWKTFYDLCSKSEPESKSW